MNIIFALSTTSCSMVQFNVISFPSCYNFHILSFFVMISFIAHSSCARLRIQFEEQNNCSLSCETVEIPLHRKVEKHNLLAFLSSFLNFNVHSPTVMQWIANRKISVQCYRDQIPYRHAAGHYHKKEAQQAQVFVAAEI